MASPSPKRKVEASSCCCCAAVLLVLLHTRGLCCCALPRTLVLCYPPTPCFPQLPPRGQSAATQSSFSVREAALPRSGMSKRSPSTARSTMVDLYLVLTGACQFGTV